MKRLLQTAGNLARRQQRRAASRARWAVKTGEEGVKDGMHATRRAGEGVRDAAVNAVKDVLRRARRPWRRHRRRKAQVNEQLEFQRLAWQIEEEIEALVARGRPILLGPWLSEVGFETLYWVPFLRWVKAAHRLPSDRLVAMSRGGVGSWYQGLASRYIEIWDHMAPSEYARRNAERGTTKQYEQSALDRDLLQAAARDLGTGEFDVLHPSLMYRLFTLYWSGQRAMGFLDAHTRYTRLDAPAILDRSVLPERYIAVKFYAARSLPDAPEIRAALRAIVASLAERLPVVLLDTGLVLGDDHADYAFPAGATVVSARAWMTPRNNLGVQTQIVAGAEAFVGTCGSLAWLAPQLGVDTSALFIDPKWLHAHLPVGMRAFHKLGAGRFSVADLRALDARLTGVPLPVGAGDTP